MKFLSSKLHGLDGVARIYFVVMGVGVLLVVAVTQTDN